MLAWHAHDCASVISAITLRPSHEPMPDLSVHGLTLPEAGMGFREALDGSSSQWTLLKGTLRRHTTS